MTRQCWANAFICSKIHFAYHHCENGNSSPSTDHPGVKTESIQHILVRNKNPAKDSYLLKNLRKKIISLLLDTGDHSPSVFHEVNFSEKLEGFLDVKNDMPSLQHEPFAAMDNEQRCFHII